jgi:hypothetical protein
MHPPVLTDRYKHPRCPAELMSQGVWLDARVGRRARAGAERLCARGIIGTYDARRKGGGRSDRQRPINAAVGALGEALSSIWRRCFGPAMASATPAGGRGLETATARHAGAAAAGSGGGHDVPRVIITAQRQRAGAATRESWPGVEHRPRRSRHHRAANSPGRPARERDGCSGARPQPTPSGPAPPPHTARSGSQAATPGSPSRAAPRPHRGDDLGRHAPSCALIMS